jgi:hypothetical protein
MISGADALKAALNHPGNAARARRPHVSQEVRESQIVNEAFKLLTPIIKGWLRSRVRQGSSAVETVAKLSTMLQAGESIANAAGGIARAIQSVRKATK